MITFCKVNTALSRSGIDGIILAWKRRVTIVSLLTACSILHSAAGNGTPFNITPPLGFQPIVGISIALPSRSRSNDRSRHAHSSFHELVNRRTPRKLGGHVSQPEPELRMLRQAKKRCFLILPLRSVLASLSDCSRRRMPDPYACVARILVLSTLSA